jgi:signal transduction histidine kinase
LPKIFDRYWQAEETKDMGAGLGLAIVKGIAEAHGGRSWAESRLGAGSSFHLALPLDRPR